MLCLFPLSHRFMGHVTALLCWGFLITVESALLLPASAVASCVESKIAIAASTVSLEGKVAAAWQLSPPCNIVESGLLVGNDPETVVPVGSPFYTLQEIYRQDLLALDPGSYWLIAYARDEEGTVIRSFPWPVHVIDATVSDPLQAARASSFELGASAAAAPPSYSGTDDDFLTPEGDPHLSMLKTWSREHKSQFTFGTKIQIEEGLRQVGDTSRDAVLSRQLQPFQGFSTSTIPNGSVINQALNQLDQLFTLAAYPRSGFYAVYCIFDLIPFFAPSCGDMGIGQQLFLHYIQDTGTVVPISGTPTSGIAVDRSNAAFFIPRLPTGKQMAEAKLRLSFVAVAPAQDLPSAIRINGQAPATVNNFSCISGVNGIPEITQCRGIATWDFTSQAQSLAAQGGGLLAIEPQLTSLFNLTQNLPDRTQTNIFGTLTLQPLAINYPWKHSNSGGALTITYRGNCKLDLVATPDSVQPRGVQTGMAGQADIEAKVENCGGSSSVVVTLQFDPDLPISGTLEAGGHAHGGSRPKGGFDTPGGPTQTQCTATIDASGAGSCTVTYFPSEVSGVETIRARATDMPDAEKKITVEVPGLVNLAAINNNFVWLNGQLPQHPDNHWGTPNTVDNIQLVALDYYADFGMKLGINDLSLLQGGLFDIAGGWRPPHRSHRTGKSVDIDRACLDPNLGGGCPGGEVSADKPYVVKKCFQRGGGLPAPEPQIHCEFPN